MAIQDRTEKEIIVRALKPRVSATRATSNHFAKCFPLQVEGAVGALNNE